MKTKRSFLLGFLALLAIGGIATGFRTAKQTGKLAKSSNIYYVYMTRILVSQDPLYSSMENTMTSSTHNMSPNVYTRTSSLTLANGSLNSVSPTNYTRNNGRCEIGWANIQNLGASPLAAAVTLTTITPYGTYNEFDIVLGTDLLARTGVNWGNGNGPFIDRGRTIRHELGHGLGLDHSVRTNSLMYSSVTTYDASFVSRDDDTYKGIKCLFDNAFCACDENGGSGATEVSMHTAINGERKDLLWNVSERRGIQGFNVYEKQGEKYIALNSKFIELSENKDLYSFALPEQASFKAKKYFLETVYDDGSGKTTFVSFKR